MVVVLGDRLARPVPVDRPDLELLVRPPELDRWPPRRRRPGPSWRPAARGSPGAACRPSRRPLSCVRNSATELRPAVSCATEADWLARTAGSWRSRNLSNDPMKKRSRACRGPDHAGRRRCDDGTHDERNLQPGRPRGLARPSGRAGRAPAAPQLGGVRAVHHLRLGRAPVVHPPAQPGRRPHLRAAFRAVRAVPRRAARDPGRHVQAPANDTTTASARTPRSRTSRAWAPSRSPTPCSCCTPSGRTGDDGRSPCRPVHPPAGRPGHRGVLLRRPLRRVLGGRAPDARGPQDAHRGPHRPRRRPARRSGQGRRRGRRAGAGRARRRRGDRGAGRGDPRDRGGRRARREAGRGATPSCGWSRTRTRSSRCASP